MTTFVKKYCSRNFPIIDIADNLTRLSYFLNDIRFNQNKDNSLKLLSLCKLYDYKVEKILDFLNISLMKYDLDDDYSIEIDSKLKDEFKSFLIMNELVHFGMFRSDNSKPWNINVEKCGNYFQDCCYIFRFADNRVRIYNFESGLYEDFSEELFGRLLSSVIKSFEKKTQIWTSKRESEIYKFIVRIAPMVTDEVNKANVRLIPVNNGIVDLDDMSLIPFTYEYFFTGKSPVDFKENAEYKMFEKAMMDTCCGDREQFRLLQEWFGVGFIRNSLPAKALFLVGDGASGKSTVADLISQLYMNVSNLTLTDISHRFEIVNMMNCEVNIGHENSGSAKDFDPNTFKIIVTGDPISLSVKHKEAIQTRITTKCIFLFNSILEIGSVDSSQGFWRRVIVMEFKNSFLKKDKEKKNLAKTLIEEEGSGILRFALEGAKRLIDNDYKFSECASSESSLEEYKRSQNPLRAFLDDNIILDDDFSLTRREIRNEFIRYCVSECISANGFDRTQIMWKEFRSWYKDKFGKEVKEFKLSYGHGFRGIRWKVKKIYVGNIAE